MDLSINKDDLTLGEKLESLPVRPGVYQFKNADGKVIYVGKAQSLRSRVRQFFSARGGSPPASQTHKGRAGASGGQKSRAPDAKLDALVSKIADIELIVTDSEVEALILEANLIKKLKPRYNVLLKDDKSYPYIVITNEPFPRVFVTRRVIRDGSRYFGPYTDVKTMRFALKTVRDIFMIRSCNFDLTAETVARRKFKICLDYHIRKCEGPCEGLVSMEQYNSMIDKVAKILRGRTDDVVSSLQSEMEQLAAGLKFEEAAKTRDRLRALSVYSQKQKVVEMKEVDRDIIAVAAKGDDACGVVFKVRDGKVLGSHHYYVSNAEGKEENEIIESLLERYYLEHEDVPDEISLSGAIDSSDVVQEWLKGKKGAEVILDIPKAGEKSKLVWMVKRNAEFLLEELLLQKMKRGDFVPHSVQSLQRDLRLPALPRRIECFDISNTQGTDSVASMVVFVDAKARKSEYRKFKIRSVAGPDDFASMREVVERRYSRLLEENGTMPDLVMVDGGKGQLSSAVEILELLKLTGLPIIGLAKRLEEVFVPGSSEPILIPRTSSALKLLQQIRDEAHRFAITYHRALRTKRILNTELDLIKGIGKKRATELLESFGSVQGVKFATEEQIAEIVGQKLASKITEYFSKDSDGKVT
ncbi:MAG: excinuclease ABC subunit C [Ignavibacteria bacterium GWA2_54_16]|nr:MAG: excinuclease ABC subunit C [Ignavibacteria bacterium GWA2_54_16]